MIDLLQDFTRWLGYHIGNALIVFWAACFAYVGYCIGLHMRNRKAATPLKTPLAYLLLTGAAPLLAGLVMFYVFVLVGAASTVQFNAGDETRMNGWSVWVDWFILLFFALIVSGVGSLIWCIYACASRRFHKWAIPAAASLVLSILGWVVVVACAPTA